MVGGFRWSVADNQTVKSRACKGVLGVQIALLQLVNKNETRNKSREACHELHRCAKLSMDQVADIIDLPARM